MDSSSDSDGDYEMCPLNINRSKLPFDVKSIENIILMLSDSFDFRVVMSDSRTKKAFIVTAGLTLAGGMIGRHYGGKVGAAIGGAVGGVCGLGIVAVSMRSIWLDIKEKMMEVVDMVYDYLAGLGIDDYRKAAVFLTQHGFNTQLALMILETSSVILGKKILSSLTAA